LAEAADFSGCASVEEGGDWTAGAWATAGEVVSKSVHRIAIVNFKRVDDCATAGRRWVSKFIGAVRTATS
jgi:hypothetical protein